MRMREMWPLLAALCALSVGGGLRLWLAPPPPNALAGYRARGTASGPRHIWDAANRRLGRLLFWFGVLQCAVLAAFLLVPWDWSRILLLAVAIALVILPMVLADRYVKALQSAPPGGAGSTR